MLFASLIGTTIEFFDFYIYATAAVLVFPQLFFPPGDRTTATLQSLATFALAFFARPVGSALFGHFGDRIGRKATLVAALLTMGLSTVAIGLLPTYATIGVAAPALLALCRLGQGLGLGGEWGGAVLLATENAPPGKASWYGMFPQLGAPLGFFCSTGIFIVLAAALERRRLPRLGLARAVHRERRAGVRRPVRAACSSRRRRHSSARSNARSACACRSSPWFASIRALSCSLRSRPLATFVLFYLMTVFTLSWGTSAARLHAQQFLLLQMLGVLFFALTIPLSALGADRIGRCADADGGERAGLRYSACCSSRSSQRQRDQSHGVPVDRPRAHGPDLRRARHGAR